MFKEFISQYGTTILYAVFTAVFGYLGILAKRVCDRILTDRAKKDIARETVRYVEQVYQQLHGAEKLEKALDAAYDMLDERGIEITDLELHVLIESAVAEFNKAFKQDVLE